MLLTHQHAALVAAVRRFAGSRTADELYGLMVADKNLFGLRAVQFIPKAKAAKLGKRLPKVAVVVDDALAATFRGGIPGFPNKLRREWFDAAWTEAMNGAA